MIEFTYTFKDKEELEAVIHVIKRSMAREPAITIAENFENALQKIKDE